MTWCEDPAVPAHYQTRKSGFLVVQGARTGACTAHNKPLIPYWAQWAE